MPRSWQIGRDARFVGVPQVAARPNHSVRPVPTANWRTALIENFWSIIWIVIWSFFFVAYLFVLFYILTDLFRDHLLSGWWKALWIVLLIFVPYLTALVYIIARGRGMAERQGAAIQQARTAQDAYIKQVAGASGGGKSVTDHIADAKALLDNGTINQSEFDQLKAKALA